MSFYKKLVWKPSPSALIKIVHMVTVSDVNHALEIKFPNL